MNRSVLRAAFAFAFVTIGLGENFFPSQLTVAQEGEITRYREVVSLGQGAVTSAHWGSHNETIVVNSSKGAWFYSANFEQIAHDENVVSVVFSPKEDYVAGIGIEDGKVYLWTPADFEHTEVVDAPSYTSVIVFSPDGTLLAGSGGNFVWIWNIADRQVLQIFETDFQVTSLDWNSSGNQLAIAGVNAIRIWSTQNEDSMEFPPKSGVAEKAIH